jgi:Tfp pilus assembly protein PilO
MKLRAGAGLWLLVGLLVCIVVLLLGLFIIVFPQKNKVSELEDQIEKAKTDIQLEQNRLNQLKQYEKDPEQFTRQIDAIKQKIPENVGLSDIFHQIDSAAEAAGIDFYSVKPSLPVSTGGYYTLTFDAKFYGRYFNLVEFFNQLEALPRTVKVVYLDLTGSDDNLPYLDITMKFRAYFTTDKGVESLVQKEQTRK